MQTPTPSLTSPTAPDLPLLQKQEGLLKITYALFALSVLLPITSIVGVVIAHIKAGDVAGTHLHSHYKWLIRTFWWSFLLAVIGAITFFFGIGFVVFIATGVWFIYRVIKGFLKLNDGLAVQ